MATHSSILAWRSHGHRSFHLKGVGILVAQSCLTLCNPMVAGQGWCREELHHAPRSGEAAERSNLTSKKRRLCGRRRAERSYSTFKVRRGSREEIPLIQGKQWRLHFAGTAMKRDPKSKVRETQVRR